MHPLQGIVIVFNNCYLEPTQPALAMKCCIIDDDIYSIERLENHINKIPELQLIGNYTDPKLALEKIKTEHRPDIVFLDIEMPELSGLEMASLLPKEIAIIFVTAYINHAHTAFEKDAVDFILKPFSFDRFVRAVNKAQNKLQYTKAEEPSKNLTTNTIFIKSGNRNKVIQINVAKIIQIEAFDHYIYIHVLGERHISYINLREIEEQLPISLFIRTHRAHIVNIDLIRSIEGNEIVMINDSKVPLSRLYKDGFLNRILPKMIKNFRSKDN